MRLITIIFFMIFAFYANAQKSMYKCGDGKYQQTPCSGGTEQLIQVVPPRNEKISIIDMVEGYLLFDYRFERYCENKSKDYNDEYRKNRKKECIDELNNDLIKTKNIIKLIDEKLGNTDKSTTIWKYRGKPKSGLELKNKLLFDCASGNISDISPKFDYMRSCLESKYQEIYSATHYKDDNE